MDQFSKYKRKIVERSKIDTLTRKYITAHMMEIDIYDLCITDWNYMQEIYITSLEVVWYRI